MALKKITQLAGRAVHVPGDDIDTDRIIPARFMKCVTFDGLGEFLFYDVRFEGEGTQRKAKQHPLDRSAHKGATILVSGNHFGCGSSREHAPQALQKFGIEAIIAGNFAEIFFGNCTGLGLPCVCLKATDLSAFATWVEANPAAEVKIDLESLEVSCGKYRYKAYMPESARQSLTQGQWDPIGSLLDGMNEVTALDAKLLY